MEGVLTVMVAVVVALCGAVTATSPNQEELLKAQEYLSQFFSDVGVSDPNSMWRSSLDSFDETLRNMQEFFGLDVTGELDSNTIQVMAQPRCGFTDVSRYGLFEGRPKWDKSLLTYRIVNYTPDLSKFEVDMAIAKALKIYSDVVPLDFKKINQGKADIMIIFKSRDHGDFAPFDGQGGVLAHAYSPGDGIGGDTHFDEDERWTMTSQGMNLFLVAAHEFGHAMGLAHSQIKPALMFPTYTYVDTDGFKLPDDDRQGVQAIYGVRETSPQQEPEPEPETTDMPATEQPEPEPEPDRCHANLIFDAATSINRKLYFFKDGHFWKRRSSWDGITQSEIQSVWPGISRVDAAYEYKRRNRVIFFEGDHYWRIGGNTVLPGYPRPLGDFGLPSDVTKVDAAVNVPLTGKTLIFVGRRYWSYNERRGVMDFGYPRLIKIELPGIGHRIDAAFLNRRTLYFTSGAQQVEYNYATRRVIRTLLNNAWMDCD